MKKVPPYSRSGWTFKVPQICILTLCCLVFVFGTIGNVYVIKLFIKSEQNPGSRLVVALACIDIFSSLILPLNTVVNYVYNPGKTLYWPFGEGVCYVVGYVDFVVPTSAWIMVAISMERYR